MTPLPHRPVFLIGTGRCGSSLLLRLLAYHPDTAWISHYTSYLPGGARWAALSRVHRLPGLAHWLPRARRRTVPQATEHYRLLNQATDHLFTAPRELTADEVTPQARAALRRLVDDHLAAQGGRVFVMKHTGYARIAYLREVFPEARFVHVMRDGRSVAASLCHVDWWSGQAHWGWGPLSDEERRIYADSGYHELVLAGLYWRKLMGLLERAIARDAAEGSVLTVRYDHLVAAPLPTLHTVADFAGLGPSEVFDARVRATPMTSDDTRWRRTLTPDEQALIDDLLAPDLAHFGFLDPARPEGSAPTGPRAPEVTP